MKTVIAWMLCATIALPVSAGNEVELAAIARVVEFHFQHTHPFYRDHHVVAATTRQKLATDHLPAVKEVIADTQAADEIIAAPEPAESLSLEKVVNSGTVDLSRFRTGQQYDWRQIAAAYPEAKAVFEVSRPTFDSAEEHAVIRLDGTKLRGGDAGVAFSLLYGLHRDVNHQWQVTQLVAPCCGPKR